jgi:hypothetical protein
MPTRLWRNIVNAYKAILDNANSASATDTTKAQYAAIGVNGVDTDEEESLLGDVIDNKASGGVDTVGKVQQLADAVQNVMDGDATQADLERLGITGVTENNPRPCKTNWRPPSWPTTRKTTAQPLPRTAARRRCWRTTPRWA